MITIQYGGFILVHLPSKRKRKLHATTKDRADEGGNSRGPFGSTGVLLALLALGANRVGHHLLFIAGFVLRRHVVELGLLLRGHGL